MMKMMQVRDYLKYRQVQVIVLCELSPGRRQRRDRGYTSPAWEGEKYFYRDFDHLQHPADYILAPSSEELYCLAFLNKYTH